jgi:hypothetical protein
VLTSSLGEGEETAPARAGAAAILLKGSGAAAVRAALAQVVAGLTGYLKLSLREGRKSYDQVPCVLTLLRDSCYRRLRAAERDRGACTAWEGSQPIVNGARR